MNHTPEMSRYISEKCTDIPKVEFNKIITDLLRDAAFKMETGIPGDIMEFVRQLLWLIETRYTYLPLSKLIEAFHKGSLGELGGTMKLSIRNINIWIKEINQEWSNGTIARRNRENMDATDIDRSEMADPYSAAAYSLRIGWGTSKRITHEQWDYLSTIHSKMVETLKGGTRVEDMSPGMFLSGFSD